MDKEINRLLEEVSRCTRCPDLKPWQKFAASAHGNVGASAILVSEAPGRESLDRGRMWCGTSGTRLRKPLLKFGVELEDIFYLTDIVKCAPPNGRRPTPQEIRNCRGYLVREIGVLKPEYILAVGWVASKYFMSNFTPRVTVSGSSMADFHNKQVQFSSFILLPLFHPSRANMKMNYEVYKRHLEEVYSLVLRTRRGG